MLFSWEMTLHSGTFVDAYDPDPSDGTFPKVSGFFVIDDQLTDSDPAADVAHYSGAALFSAIGPMGTFFSAAAVFTANFGTDVWNISVAGPGVKFLLDFTDAYLPPTKFEELFVGKYNWIEGTFVWNSLFAGSDNEGHFSLVGPYVPPFPVPTKTVPDNLGLVSVAMTLGLMAIWSRRTVCRS